MLSHEELAYQKVARLVVHYFYDIEETLVMEVLLNSPRRQGDDGKMHPTLQLDKRVAERLKLGEKQVRKIRQCFIHERNYFLVESYANVDG